MFTPKRIKIEMVLEDEALGMANANPEVHEEFIASKSSDAEKSKEELEALPASDLIEKARTVFPQENGIPFLWDYQLRGWVKDGITMLLGIKGTLCSQRFTAWTYRKVIDGCVFVKDRKNFFELPNGAKIGECVRPLRAMTMQGPRVSLATSETIPAGSKISFVLEILEPVVKRKKSESEEDKAKTPVSLPEIIKEICDYGKYRGLGQWRNSGKGRFTYTMQEME